MTVEVVSKTIASEDLEAAFHLSQRSPCVPQHNLHLRLVDTGHGILR